MPTTYTADLLYLRDVDEVSSSHALRVEFEPSSQKDVYFTGDIIEGTVRISNLTDRAVIVDRGINIEISRSEGTEPILADRILDVRLQPDETVEEDIETYVTYQSDYTIGVPSEGTPHIEHSEGTLMGIEEDGRIKIQEQPNLIRYSEKLDSASLPIFSFTAWDPDFYELHYQRPRDREDEFVELQEEARDQIKDLVNLQKRSSWTVLAVAILTLINLLIVLPWGSIFSFVESTLNSIFS